MKHKWGEPKTEDKYIITQVCKICSCCRITTYDNRKFIKSIYKRNSQIYSDKPDCIEDILN